MIRIFRNANDCLIQTSDRAVRVDEFSFNALFRSDDPERLARDLLDQTEPCPVVDEVTLAGSPTLPPIAHQEVWAAGVTYFRSRSARMEESQKSGGDQFYDLVYEAERPELFFKATGPRARGHLDQVRIRADSDWNVPEPELTLAINHRGHVFGYTIGNDMSSRSIEGENPLYLPQAKVYRGSCAIGPCLVIGNVINKETEISVSIERSGTLLFSGSTNVSQIKRSFDELAEFLFRENEFPNGAYLMTGTGIVPASDFTLTAGDKIRIVIEPLGVLENIVESPGPA